MFGHIAKCTERVFPMSLVKSIMQYTSVNPKWGRLNEVSAKMVLLIVVVVDLVLSR